MKNLSRRSFLKSIAALAVLPLAGKSPKQDEELGEVDLSDVLESPEQSLTIEESKYTDSPYFCDGGGSLRLVHAVWLTPDGKTLDGEYKLIDTEWENEE